MYVLESDTYQRQKCSVSERERNIEKEIYIQEKDIVAVIQRQRDRETKIQRYRETEKQSNNVTRLSGREAEKLRAMERPRNLELWRDRETKNQRDRETEKQRNREPEIKKETSRHKVTKKQKRKTHRTGPKLCKAAVTAGTIFR